MSEEIVFTTADHPEANGAKPNPGDRQYPLQFPLEDGRTLIIRMGQRGFDIVTQLLMDMLAEAPSHSNGSVQGIPVQLRHGHSTGLCDKHGKPIHIGDQLSKPVECNEELHGPYAIYEVKAQGITPILSYLRSAKGQVIPEGYFFCLLADEYDHKMFLWANKLSDLRPLTDIEVIDEE